MNMNPRLETDALILEPLVSAHAPLIYDALCDERIYAYIAQRPPESLETLAQRFHSLSSRRSPDGNQLWLNWVMRGKQGGYAGWLQATVQGEEADIAYIVFPKFWRLGFASQACRKLLEHLASELDVRRASATVDTENAASIRLLEALGFTRTSTQPATDMPGRLEHLYAKRLGLPD